MTLLKVSVNDIGITAVEGDTIRIYSPRFREWDKKIISTAPLNIRLDKKGMGSKEVAPGDMRVEFRCRNFKDSRVFPVVVPDSREAVDLVDLLRGSFTFTEPVVSEVGRIRDDVRKISEEVGDSRRIVEKIRTQITSDANKSSSAKSSSETAAQKALQSEKLAKEYSSGAKDSESAAQVAQEAAELARDKALASERAAGEYAKTAAQSVEQAAIHEQAAKVAQSGVTDALNGAKDARTGAEKARDEARQAAESAIVGIKPDSVQKSMLAEDLRGEIDAKADKSTVEKQLGEKVNSADVDRKIGEIPRPTWEGLEGKPADFKPSAHTHATKEITGLDDALKEKADLSVVDERIRAIPKPVSTWEGLEGKPAKFPPEAHAHGIGDVNGLLEQLRGKASESDVSALRARMANLSFAVVDSLPSYPNHNTVYFVR
ncbi:hypothetical protein I4J10_10265 [Corynebacterium diphtheriae bv. mitis]|uniref:hypothetical protein n=1 Tax=Corynebacterium diphtheriae TaxID=1717 RepID=UPI0018C9622D|nr:hypothetical protein [Corynebacterium diphtheriae]MBG9277542.1 hypothetical protein [Corynebacterium diphtheriae bv. mitis]